jgi:hypothetical protein
MSTTCASPLPIICVERGAAVMKTPDAIARLVAAAAPPMLGQADDVIGEIVRCGGPPRWCGGTSLSL